MKNSKTTDHKNSDKTMILASASPRRIEMFRKNGFDPKVIPSDYEENIPDSMTPAETVMFLALQKGLSVYRTLCCSDLSKADSGTFEEKFSARDSIDPNEYMIISADTIVVDYTEGRILGKPKSEKEAYEMLSSLSGRSHHVLTGVCLISRNNDQFIKCFYESSEVFFKDIPVDELYAYVKTDEPYDKAGGYAIQETFGKYTDHIIGDLDNIIGFPFQRFLKEANITPIK